jgi:hypothetical protein
VPAFPSPSPSHSRLLVASGAVAAAVVCGGWRGGCGLPRHPAFSLPSFLLAAGRWVAVVVIDV